MKYEPKINTCAFFSRKFMGFGLMFDARPAISMYDYYVVEIILFYFRAWITIPKKTAR